MSRAKFWCFTLNNYTVENEDRIRSAFTAGGINYIVYGKEVGSSGTPHLQGFCAFETRKRLAGCVSSLGQAHWTVCRKIPAAIEYCKKDGLVTEYGTYPDIPPTKGARNDLEEFKAAVKGGMVDLKELRETHSGVCMRYPRFVLSYVRDNKPLPPIPDHPLRDWQSLLLGKLDQDPDSRTVIFVVDKKGNKGKSYLCSYLERERKGVQIMKCGKRDDMAFELDDNPKIVVIDVARSSSDFLHYTFLEDLKDGRVFSPKYESHQKRFNPPHVVVMMNVDPDMTRLSEDRYDIIFIN